MDATVCEEEIFFTKATGWRHTDGDAPDRKEAFCGSVTQESYRPGFGGEFLR